MPKRTLPELSRRQKISATIVAAAAIVGSFAVAALPEASAPLFAPEVSSLENPSPNVPPSEEHRYLDIPEVGLRITVPEAVPDLTFISQPEEHTLGQVGLSTLATRNQCAFGYLGRIIKVEGSATNAPGPYNLFDEQGNKMGEYLLRQFDGYYVQHIPSQNPCRLPDGRLLPDRATNDAVRRAIRNAEPL